MIARSLCLLVVTLGLVAMIAGVIAGSSFVVVNGFLLVAASMLTIGVVYCLVFGREAKRAQS